jgi:hypothetical protein
MLVECESGHVDPATCANIRKYHIRLQDPRDVAEFIFYEKSSSLFPSRASSNSEFLSEDLGWIRFNLVPAGSGPLAFVVVVALNQDFLLECFSLTRYGCTLTMTWVRTMKLEAEWQPATRSTQELFLFRRMLDSKQIHLRFTDELVLALFWGFSETNT